MRCFFLFNSFRRSSVFHELELGSVRFFLLILHLTLKLFCFCVNWTLSFVRTYVWIRRTQKLFVNILSNYGRRHANGNSFDALNFVFNNIFTHRYMLSIKHHHETISDDHDSKSEKRAPKKRLVAPTKFSFLLFWTAWTNHAKREIMSNNSSDKYCFPLNY